MEEKINSNDFNKKIIETVEKVSLLRGLVITKFIDIEKYIEVIIENYFVLPGKGIMFKELVLSDSYFNFGLKKKILLGIIDKIKFEENEKFEKDLYKIEKIRNRLAHSGMFGFDGHLIYQGDKKVMEIKEVEELYNDFMLLWVKIYPELQKIFQKVIETPKPL